MSDSLSRLYIINMIQPRGSLKKKENFTQWYHEVWWMSCLLKNVCQKQHVGKWFGRWSRTSEVGRSNLGQLCGACMFACDIIIACSLSLYLDWLHVSQHRRITSTCPSEQYNRRRSWRTSKQEKTHKVILCRFCCFRCLEQFYTDAILLPLLFHCLWLDGILIVTVHSSLAVVLPLRPLS